MTKGELNPRAVLSDDEVELLRSLRDGEAHLPRARRYWTAPRLAEKFEISVRHVWYILSYKQRVQSADDGASIAKRSSPLDPGQTWQSWEERQEQGKKVTKFVPRSKFRTAVGSSQAVLNSQILPKDFEDD